MNTFPGLVHTARQAMGAGGAEVRDRKERPRAKLVTGLSRNKVAVPEGAAGTPPFWSFISKVSCLILQRKF